MRKLFAFFLALMLSVPAGAVLKERDLARTLEVLRAELEMSERQQQAFMARYRSMQDNQHNQLVDYMQRSEQIALMLYSQHYDYTFDLTYACQQATDLYNELSGKTLPYARIQNYIANELARYDGLIRNLENLPPRVKVQSDGTVIDPQKVLQHHIVVDSVEAATIARVDSIANDLGISDTVLAAARDSVVQISNAYKLTAAQQADRNACLTIAFRMRENLQQLMEDINEDNLYYTTVSGNVESLYDYAQGCYRTLQKSIFVNGGDNYFKTLMNLPLLLPQAQREVSSKYGSFEERGANFSEWRGPVVQFIVFVLVGWGLVSTLLSRFILQFLPQRYRPADYEAKRNLYHIVAGIFIFVSVVMLLRTFLHQHFLLLAANLVVSIAWLSFAIFLSLLIRINIRQIRSSIRIYIPILIMASIVIVFRMLFIPNNLVNLIYPPILLGFCFWQASVMRAPKGSIPSSDILYTSVSMGALVIATLLAWCGYVLFAVEIMIWWMFQLAALQTITFIYHLLERYEQQYVVVKIRKSQRENRQLSLNAIADPTTGQPTADQNENRKGADGEGLATNEEMLKLTRQGDFIHLTFIFDFVGRALVPILAILSSMMSLWYAAGIFEMTDLLRNIFYYNFVDKADIIQLSLHKLVIVACCWFVFRYLNYLLRSLYHRLVRLRSTQHPGHLNFTLADNVIAILVWGSFVLYALYLLQVPKTGLSVVTAGLATGMGFAMKDLLENFFYGISLMTGRVRVGDYIECDGIQGRVESITYQSTQLITLDGSVIAFLNAQLFNKNFKNLTRNHHYELVKIPIGVGYGCDIQQVREMLTEAITPILRITLEDGRELLKSDTAVSVVFSDFGASSVDLLVCYWILVDQKSRFGSMVKEAIYNTLTQRGVEIPFPQCDVHIKQ